MYTIDAQNKSLGRVASEVAMILMGKDKADYRPNVVADVKVEIQNASKVKINPKNLKNKLYKRYSGYPGGLKETPMKKVIEKKGYSEIFEIAVKGMLPANKLRPLMMKNLEVTE